MESKALNTFSWHEFIQVDVLQQDRVIAEREFFYKQLQQAFNSVKYQNWLRDHQDKGEKKAYKWF